MTFATRLTKVRYRSEHFDERTGMCYHQAPPSERVVVHVRDAGQAKPHLEHNPLSLLGACYATPRRQLNDPDNSLSIPQKLGNVLYFRNSVSQEKPETSVRNPSVSAKLRSSGTHGGIAAHRSVKRSQAP